MDDQSLALSEAWNIVDNGKFYENCWYDDGEVESGPMGGVQPGFALDKRRVELGPNGSVSIYDDDGEWTENWRMVYNSMDLKSPRSARALARYLREAGEAGGDPHEVALAEAKERVKKQQLDSMEVDALNRTERVRQVRGHGIEE